MAIHIGKKIREEVDRQKIPITTFAKKINRSRNVVYNIFERESIDTSLLNKIGKILNCDFFSLYSIQKEYSSPEIRNFYVSEGTPTYSRQNEEMKALQKQNEQLMSEIIYLKKIITLLENRKSKGKRI
jgi:hypothetical protein